MQLASKVVRLDLNYSSAQRRLYKRATCYLSPFHDETAEHFARRILAYLALFEYSPQWAKQDSHGKTPDLFILDQYQQIKLWCAVDVLDEKLVQRASHQAEQVWLMLDGNDVKSGKNGYRQHFANLQYSLLDHDQLLAFCQMLKGHMQLNVWQDDDQLLIADGQYHLELTIRPLLLH